MWKNNISNLIKSILAGSAIGIGAMIFLSLGGVAGAVGFTIGLYLVLWFGLNLYTGKVGYATTKPMDWINLSIMLISNAIGCLIMLLIFTNPVAQTLILTKLAISPLITFIKAIICGVLIYAAVDQYKRGREYAPIIAVPAFILCGAEHCVADICFFIAAGLPLFEFIPFISIVVIGNSIGSLLFKYATS